LVLAAGDGLVLPHTFGALTVAALAGLALGRWLAPRLPAERHERLVLAVLAATALAAGASAVA
ncbi:MAG: hypothetical protein HZB46_03805, partial [Solirubrobacterales bacterium]|nr:hypothetical protein [Solirubrobacterales bacterium]